MDKKLQIEILANTKQAVEDIKKLENEIKKFSDDVKKGNVDLKKQETQLASLAGSIKKVVGAYMGFQAARGAINIVADFEQSIAKLGAISGASKENLDKLKQKAEELGKSTMFSASEVAEGMNYLAMAGYKTKDIMASIGDVLNLAAVGQINLGQASDIASNILSGFNLKAEETKRVVDVMTATITNANTNIPEMGEAMKYVAPQARALGVSLEETATAIGVLSNSGIKATMAGTGLSTMLVRLASPTGRAKDAINELGIKLYDANGKFVGLTEVLKQFKDKMKNMSQEMKAKYMRDIFGLETMKTAITLIDSVGNGYDELYSKIAKSMGITEEKVKQMTDTFNGHMKELESAFQGLILTIGEELLPALTGFVEILTKAISGLDSFYKANDDVINAVVSLVATMYALKKAVMVYELIAGSVALARFIRLAKAVRSLSAAFTLLGNALKGLDKASKIIYLISLAVGAATYVYEKFTNTTEENEKAIQKNGKAIKKQSETLKEHTKTLKENTEETERAADAEDKLSKKAEDYIKTLDKRIEKEKQKYKTLDELRKEELKKAFEEFSETSKIEEIKSKITAYYAIRSLEEIKSAYEKRVREHQNTLDKLKKQEENLTKQIEELNKQLQERLKTLDDERVARIRSIEEKIHNIQMSNATEYEKYIDKQKQAEELLAKAKEAIKEKEFKKAKEYMQKYEDIVTSLANKEIKENEEVKITKEKSNKYVIQSLNKLQEVTNLYYKTQKKAEKESFAQKIENLQKTKEGVKITVKDFILKHESLRLKPYEDTVGKLTIGVGRNLDDVGISEDEAMYLLNNDIRCKTELIEIFDKNYITLPANVKIALIDMIFNLGKTRFLTFKNMIQAIKDKDFKRAA